jgi:hypothetical protein
MGTRFFKGSTVGALFRGFGFCLLGLFLQKLLLLLLFDIFREGFHLSLELLIAPRSQRVEVFANKFLSVN